MAVGEVFGVSFEDGCAGVFVGEGEVDGEVDPAEHGGVEVDLPVGGADEEDVGAGLEAVDLPEEGGEDAPAGLVHVGAPVAGERVDLVDEDDHLAQLLAQLPHLRQLRLALPVVLAHYRLRGDVDQRDVHLLRDYLRACRLPRPRRALEEHGFGSVGLVLHASIDGDFIIDFGVVECEQHCVLDESLLVFVAGKAVPIEGHCFVVGIEDSQSQLAELVEKLVPLLLLHLRRGFAGKSGGRLVNVDVILLRLHCLFVYCSQRLVVFVGDEVVLVED